MLLPRSLPSAVMTKIFTERFAPSRSRPKSVSSTRSSVRAKVPCGVESFDAPRPSLRSLGTPFHPPFHPLPTPHPPPRRLSSLPQSPESGSRRRTSATIALPENKEPRSKNPLATRHPAPYNPLHDEPFSPPRRSPPPGPQGKHQPVGSILKRFSLKMKAAGIVIVIASVIAMAILVWLFHLFTFGEPNPRFMFESEPPEGYDYWSRKSFWAEFWPFIGYSSLVIATGLIPLVALLFATPRRSRKATITIAALGAVLAIAPGAMTVMSVAAGNFHFVFWAPPILLAGCIYALIRAMVTLTKTQGEQGGGGKPATGSELT